jgi:hypothetical protein
MDAEELSIEERILLTRMYICMSAGSIRFAIASTLLQVSLQEAESLATSEQLLHEMVKYVA